MAVTFISEISSNHHQDLNRCFEFIDTSAEIGCSAVKFQLFKIEKLFSKEILAKSETHRARKEWELPVSFLPHLAKRCHDRKIQFGCTPFYLEAVDELLPHTDFFKIASYELLWEDLLKKCAETEKPIILSTGMATMDEIKSSADVLCQNGCSNLTVLHCVSSYPTPKSDCNLAAIETLRSALQPVLSTIKYSVGWSDHSVSPGVLFRAVHRWKARTIEFHLDLEGKGAEYKSRHCWLPDQIRYVIDETRGGIIADGNGQKEPAASELSDREWRADPEDGLRPLKHIRKNF
ncbi:N-acetylneuraminate synthase family protein [Desulfospira joergensenii]|uniref:N-acetylneuraminate synthase family protein n=1 Tax=Desulfospira joergensenii TaxID=53329 RepID=UPI0004863C0F|nr:N-acetylneuraminate synthase family protein [Desulfospira joergensenii]